MIKLMYVTGDSFAFGAELGDDPNVDSTFKFSEYRRKHSYTGIITDRLSIPNYINNACPGGSNERAYRVLLQDVSKQLKIYKPEEIFVMVTMSHITRREFCMSDSGQYYIHLNTWKPTNGIKKTVDMWELLVKDFNYDLGHYMFNMMILLGIQNFLRAAKVPYLITTSMDTHADHDLTKKYVAPTLLDQIYKKRYYNDPSFAIYTLDLPRGKQVHPLEEGHLAWADHLMEYINNNNLLSNEDL